MRKRVGFFISLLLVVALSAGLVLAFKISVTGNAITGYQVSETGYGTGYGIPLIQCSDSDGGFNIFLKGFTKGDNIPSGKYDYCSGSTLYEYFCINNYNVSVNRTYCPNGCVDGACVEQSERCSDSDGGLVYNKKGIITVGDDSAEDVCIDYFFVKEYDCSLKDNDYYDNYFCTGGCVDGACVDKVGNLSCSDFGFHFGSVGGRCNSTQTRYDLSRCYSLNNSCVDNDALLGDEQKYLSSSSLVQSYFEYGLDCSYNKRAGPGTDSYARDACIGNVLHEATCGLDGQHSTQFINCTYGCVKGACLREGQNITNQSRICREGDGAVNIMRLNLNETKRVIIDSVSYDVYLKYISPENAYISIIDRSGVAFSEYVSNEGSIVGNESIVRFGNGLSVALINIFYQGYAGGTNFVDIGIYANGCDLSCPQSGKTKVQLSETKRIAAGSRALSINLIGVSSDRVASLLINGVDSYDVKLGTSVNIIDSSLESYNLDLINIFDQGYVGGTTFIEVNLRKNCAGSGSGGSGGGNGSVNNTCYDSDGGVDISVKGITTSAQGNQWADDCTIQENSTVGVTSCNGSSCYVSEHSCGYFSDSKLTFDGVYFRHYLCPQGCVDGVCLSNGSSGGGGSGGSGGGGSGGSGGGNSGDNETFCSSGCYADEKCYPYGYRKDGEFCSISNKFVPQGDKGAVCQNHFECSSNFCVEGYCESPTFVQKVLRFFRNLFGLG